ncbi:MAG TPA: arsinothricin resistance N-acetyltransferase ArsN1 family B [Caulobacteraceae bacterium]|nr:arsinothricin resistance N-acetyltransferase ArsN1 family B [Caulobacteraceae bacterium]
MSRDHINIRPAEVADAAAVQAIYAPMVERTTISFEEVAPSITEMGERIAVALQTHGYYVAERDGRVVGYAYGSQHRARAAYRRSADVAIYVAEEARGIGVGRALYQVLLPRLSDLGFHRAYAGIALPNPASIALHESVGFAPAGIYREVGFKFDRWLDVGWWEKRLDDG